MFNLHFILVGCEYNSNISQQYSTNISESRIRGYFVDDTDFLISRNFPSLLILIEEKPMPLNPRNCDTVGACYLGNRLKLAVCVMDQVHHGADGSRGVEILRQSI